MIILSCGNNICKMLAIPSNNVNIPNIVVTLDVPADLNDAISALIAT